MNGCLHAHLVLLVLSVYLLGGCSDLVHIDYACCAFSICCLCSQATCMQTIRLSIHDTPAQAHPGAVMMHRAPSAAAKALGMSQQVFMSMVANLMLACTQEDDRATATGLLLGICSLDVLQADARLHDICSANRTWYLVKVRPHNPGPPAVLFKQPAGVCCHVFDLCLCEGVSRDSCHALIAL